MIFVDSDEKRHIGDMLAPLGENMKYLTTVSKYFGCDAVVSRLKKEPASKGLAKAHCRAGAQLIEIKRGTDFINSLNNGHLEHQILRMSKIASSPANVMVLASGLWIPNNEGELRIVTFNGEKVVYENTRFEYRVARRRLAKLLDSGLLKVFWITSDYEIAEFLADKDGHIQEYALRPVKVLFPRSLSVAKDGIAFLRFFENVGANTARDIMRHCGTVAYSLALMTEPDGHKQIKGFGPATVEKARKLLGLHDGTKMAVVPDYAKFCKKCLVSWDTAKYDACPVCQGKD